MSVEYCKNCEKRIDTDFQEDHFIYDDNGVNYCLKEITEDLSKLESIDSQGKRYFYTVTRCGRSVEYSLEAVVIMANETDDEFESVDFETFGHSVEFDELMADQDEENRLDHKYPNR